MTVLALVTLAVWAAAFLIPPGSYERDAEGRPIAGSYQRVEDDRSLGERLSDLFLSPVNGLYGVQDQDSGEVGPDMVGALFGSAGVFFFVLAIGAFITMVFATGALDRGIARLAHRLRDRGALLIAAIMAVFAVLGSVEGFAEETLGFYGLIVPLVLALGYDRMVAVGAIILGAGIGVLCSTVNPFSTGVASPAAGVSLGDGLPLRAAMLVVLTAVTIGHVLRYAARVKARPEASLAEAQPGDGALGAATADPEPLTGTHKAVIALLVAAFAVMVYAVLPWAGILTGDPGAEPYPWELGWSFPELSALFLVAAVLVGVVARMGEKGLTDTLVGGAADFIGPGLVIVAARGVTAIMNNAQITDTVLHSMEDAVSGTSSGLFAVLVFVVNLPLAFLIPSTSGHSTLAMPVMAPLAEFADVPADVVVTAWQSASGWMNLWVPTTAVVMGGLALAKVGYGAYLRFLWPLLAVLFVLVCAFVAGAAAFG
ncbi:YfcC family protein [Nocardiopsis potens]|uniref:YfcC family protein n=1 Tax=Nocardiopsis potens TaxID=1246458 RepID=UPI0009D9853F|nr:YfcC family protein [Nocardiopsis potens]